MGEQRTTTLAHRKGHVLTIRFRLQNLPWDTFSAHGTETCDSRILQRVLWHQTSTVCYWRFNGAGELLPRGTGWSQMRSADGLICSPPCRILNALFVSVTLGA